MPSVIHSSSAHAAQDHAKPALVFMGRLGYAARGLIYFTVGLLACFAAFGESGGEVTGAEGAASTIDQLPMGDALLVIAGIGLVCYAGWRFVQASTHRDDDEHPARTRLRHALDGVLHLGIAVTVFSVVGGQQSSGGEQKAADWTAAVMAQPFGRWLVVAVGLFAIGGGLYYFRRAMKRDYTKDLRADTSPKARRIITKLGRFGEAARSVVFVIVGIFLLRAGWQHDPQESVGLAGALHALAAQPLGWFWLALIAIGFVAFGLFSVMQSRYRRIG